MPSLMKQTREIEAKLHSLLAELQILKEQVRSLEEENALLRRELHVFHEAWEKDSSAVKNHQQDASLENLQVLYEQGFHICNIRFGEKRTEGCLFCMAFLRRKDE